MLDAVSVGGDARAGGRACGTCGEGPQRASAPRQRAVRRHPAGPMAQGVLDLEYSSNSFNSTDQSPQWAPGPQSTPPDDGRGPLGHEKGICVRCFHLFEAMRF